MIAIEIADLVVIASRVLGLDTSATLDLLDTQAAGAALTWTPHGDGGDSGGDGAGDPARRGAALLYALVTRRPFRRGNRRIALVATLQFLALNGCEADLDPPEATDAVLAEVAAGGLDHAGLAAWLAPRVRPLGDSRAHTSKEAPMRWLPRRRKRPQSKGMFTRFTDRARHAIMVAQDEARGLGHAYIGTEHLLLSLVAERDGVAARALATLDITLDAARAAVERRIGRGKGAPPGHIPYTPRAKKVLELSLREALQLGHNYIGTEHILLGLVREGEGVAAQVLVELGADLTRVRQQVTLLLSELPAPSEATPPPLRRLDDEIAEVRRWKDAAIDEAAFETARALRDAEKHLLIERVRREKEWAAGPETAALVEENDRLRRELKRLHGLLREHGIDPDAGTSQTA